MRIEKYQIYSCLRITFCISVIAIWSTWLFIIPESKEQKAEVRRQKTRSKDRDIAHNVSAKAGSRKQETRIETLHATSQQKQEAKIETLHAMSQQKQEAQVLDIKSEMLNAQSSNQLKVNSQKLIVPKPQPPILNSQLSIINPKASPLPIAKSQKPIAVDTKPNKLNLDINLPNTASATRKILLATKHSNSSNSNEQSQANTSLRKQAHTEKNSFKVRDIADDLNSDISWVPKYLAEDTNLEQNKIMLSNNLDLIVSQLEVTEITNNPPNNIHAIKIKNSITNKIEILKLGDKYEGLKLLEINQDNIVLGNENLNKTYTKKLNKD